MSPRSCCILLFTLQKACYTRIVCLFPRSVVSCCLLCRRLVTRVSCVCPREAVVSCCLPCRRLVTRVACVVPREAFVHSCKCCFCCFPSSAGDKGEGEVARGLSYRMANFLYRRRGRVARGKPLGLVILPYAGRVAGSATGCRRGCKSRGYKQTFCCLFGP